MQPYIILHKTTLQLGVRNLPKVFTRQQPGGELNHVSMIRKSDALPVSHRKCICMSITGWQSSGFHSSMYSIAYCFSSRV